MARTNWPAIIDGINQRHKTSFKMCETKEAIEFLIDVNNSCIVNAAASIGLSKTVMYKKCSRLGIKMSGRHMLKVSWKECLIRINKAIGTSYTADDMSDALKAIIDREGGYRRAAAAICCSETAIRRKAMEFKIYSPFFKGKRQTDAVRPMEETISVAEWRKYGGNKPPCIICQIGNGTKDRPECDACIPRHEYAMQSEILPSRRYTDTYYCSTRSVG